ncbi:MAG: ABC transporter ATP-binding protein [Nitrososphaerales archaeon]
MLEFQKLTKSFSKKFEPAILSVEFDVLNGETVGFVGLNGAGKTTTIRIAAGVALPTSGSVSVDSYNIVTQKVDASRQIGWVPEFPNFELNAKASNLMLYYAGFYGIERSEAEKRTRNLLEQVNLGGFENRKLRTYSQGMKKRFSLAASMLADPRNYLFDEILNGLDPEGIHFMRKLILELRKKDKAILLSSHILSEVEALADRVVFIHKGKVLKIATRSELSGLESRGKVLRLVVEKLNDYALSYLKTLGDDVQIAKEKKEEWKRSDAYEERHVVIIRNFQGESSTVNSELVKTGVKVDEISFQKSSLEDYFFKLVGAGDMKDGTKLRQTKE